MTEGQVLAGKYRVERVLGEGGMGVVVAAHHIGLNERVAIKFLRPEMLANPEAVALFAREARAAVRIKSENVARVLDVGTLETGAPYMVMEYLEGSDLGTWVERGALPIEQAVDFVIQACVAIAEAHGLGIIHRDLKPSNLFCVRGADGRLTIKVLDFGISKVASLTATGSTASTKTGAMMGSPRYMSPEHVQSAKIVDARTDIWALGIVLYELLTGRPPFGSETAEIYVQIATHTPEPLRTFRPDLPDGLEGVFRKCTEKDRERRYANVAELALALLPYAPRSSKAAAEKVARIVQSSGLSATALSVPPSPPVAPRIPPATELGLGSTAAPPVGHRGRIFGPIVGVAAIGAAAIALIILAATRHWPTSEPAAPPRGAVRGGTSSWSPVSPVVASESSAQPATTTSATTPSATLTPTPTPTPIPTRSLVPTSRAITIARPAAPVPPLSVPAPASARPQVVDPIQALKPHQ